MINVVIGAQTAKETVDNNFNGNYFWKETGAFIRAEASIRFNTHFVLLFVCCVSLVVFRCMYVCIGYIRNKLWLW